ncbi:MAG: hypothetical protein KA974_11755 [Saprospiraceae bacterium]|nr:hypothetical protein [Saprospiraceae bacterium]
MGIKEIAEKIKGNYWSKNGFSRCYIDFGINTANTKTKCYIDEDADVGFRIVVRVYNDKMHNNWCISQAEKVKQQLELMYNEVLSHLSPSVQQSLP